MVKVLGATQQSPQTLLTVPFVGCPAEGMSGPVAAPKGEPLQLQIPPDAAGRLALYSDGQGLSILAPRNWHCYETYGSDGGYLIVSPHPVTPETVHTALHSGGFTHPVIVLSAIDGFTSGRDEVSPIINRVFPRHRKFVIDTAATMDRPVPPKQDPFRTDKLHYLSSEALEYTTPAYRKGLGTDAWLRPSSLPIIGVEILTKDRDECCNLTSLAVRLSPADQPLAPVIRRYVER